MIAGVEEQHRDIGLLLYHQVHQNHAIRLKARCHAGCALLLAQYTSDQLSGFLCSPVQIRHQMPSPSIRDSSGSNTPLSSRDRMISPAASESFADKDDSASPAANNTSRPDSSSDLAAASSSRSR